MNCFPCSGMFFWPLRNFIFTVLTYVLSILFIVQASAADPVSISIELNKLEPKDKSCRAYIVVENTNSNSYAVFKLDLVLFQPDGVIGRRVAIDLAPLKPNKKTVKLFDLDGTPCDTIGSFLVNDVVECKSESAPIEDCLSGVKVKSLTQVQLTK